MSIGSAFDAHVKSYLHEALFGKGNNPAFEFNAIFESQVESHNRDWARDHGAVCFERYRDSGALADLLLELRSAIGTPHFEIEIKGMVQANRHGVPFLGKPDVYYTNKEGLPVIYDWKVNGWCGKGNTSPKPGYLKLRHGSKDRSKDNGHHRDAHPMRKQGMLINAAHTLEAVNEEWAIQLAVYGWVCGMEVGSEFIVGIDQIACKNIGQKYPDIRIAEHRTTISSDYQWASFGRAVRIWNAIQTGHVFTEMTKEENDARCAALDARSAVTAECANSTNTEDHLFNQM